MACISVNPRKANHVYYKLTKETVDSNFFMEFIKEMIQDGFLLPKEVLILDNAAVHRGKAAQELEDDLTRPIGDIALSVGYDSEASFSAAFKRQFGKPPGAWRKDNLVAANAGSKSA